ncbi:hypothetical protein IVA93_37920 (plasmid) [Bradyrhizobium sp. 155]|uniref:hypothetical protein n=1 Tax=Bradyrhizobium sp. 155 TaxID=2782629 RepID=UPI001FFF3E9D|nr:hypothetical protein [Bradyrhizobium sp. 155]UPK15873.1 hypothetical protein IVA93_37920 [Bradyrhizobium sp. 155]
MASGQAPRSQAEHMTAPSSLVQPEKDLAARAVPHMSQSPYSMPKHTPRTGLGVLARALPESDDIIAKLRASRYSQIQELPAGKIKTYKAVKEGTGPR